MNLADDHRKHRIELLGYDYQARSKRQIEFCNLCGESVFTTLVHVDRYGYPASAQACRACGLTFLNPVMTGEAYGEFYRGVYRPLVSAYHGRLIDAANIQDEQRSYAKTLAALLDHHVAPLRGGQILDIGGSTGVVAHHFARAFAMHGTVIDPAPMEVEVASRLETETITGFVETYDPGKNRYQLVLMCQTVDHLLDIDTTLHKVRELLSDNGVFFIDIVDFRAAYRRNGSVEQAVKIDHPYYLTEATMEAFLKRAGFAVREIDYARDHLHIGFVCTKGQPEHNALPSGEDVRDFFHEVRAVQNRVPTPAP